MRPEKEKVGVHIGLPKTGTTTFQELCFSRHPELRYFGQTNVWKDIDAKTLLRALLLKKADAEDGFKASRIVTEALKEHKAVVISDEALTFGEFMLRAGKWPIVSDPEPTAKRIQRILGPVQILLVIRNQADWLVSWHRQGLKTGKYIETDFERWLGKDLGQNKRRLFSLLHYDRLYSAYAQVFEHRRVHLRLYERHRTDLASIAEDFAGSLGTNREHVRNLIGTEARNITGNSFHGLSPFLQRAIRQRIIRKVLDRLPSRLRQSLRNAAAIKRSYVTPPKKTLSDIRKHFSDNNKTLFHRLGIDAEGLGYFDEA